MVGKFTYSRKKRSTRTQILDESRKKDNFGDLSEMTEVEAAVLNIKKSGSSKCQDDLSAKDSSLQASVQMNLYGDCSLVRKTSSRKTKKPPRAIQSMASPTYVYTGHYICYVGICMTLFNCVMYVLSIR